MGGTERTRPAAISLTGPCPAPGTGHARRPFAYGPNVMIDAVSGVVPEVEAATARGAGEPDAGRRMVERMRDRRGIVPGMLAAYTGHGWGHFLA